VRAFALAMDESAETITRTHLESIVVSLDDMEFRNAFANDFCTYDKTVMQVSIPLVSHTRREPRTPEDKILWSGWTLWSVCGITLLKMTITSPVWFGCAKVSPCSLTEVNSLTGHESSQIT
jgi:hypothetical protein